MAAMNYKGAILATRRLKPNEDDYQKEESPESTVVFKNFKFNCEKFEWILHLAGNESAEAVCIGSTWCAVSTDLQLIRIFCFSGF